MSEYDHDEMLKFFNNFDSDNNGALDFSEFAKLIRSLGLNLGNEQLKTGFNKIDIDNNNVINFEEFMTWWGEQN